MKSLEDFKNEKFGLSKKNLEEKRIVGGDYPGFTGEEFTTELAIGTAIDYRLDWTWGTD